MKYDRSRSAVAILIGLATAVFCIGAGKPRRPSARWPAATVPQGAMSFAFVDLPSSSLLAGSGSAMGQIDLGRVSRSSPRERDRTVRTAGSGFNVSTRFGIVVTDPTNQARTASLMAWLPVPSAPLTIRIDGIRVDSVARVVCPHIPAGRITAHRIDISVPGDLTEENARVLNDIQFMLVPE